MSEVQVIAVPSNFPGGLEAARSGHFGRCDIFTLVTMKGKEIESVKTVPNVDHSEGGCLVPVQILHGAGATSLVVAGIGMRPRVGFAQAGIEVLVGPGATVGEVIEAYRGDLVQPIADSDLCGAHAH